MNQQSKRTTILVLAVIGLTAASVVITNAMAQEQGQVSFLTDHNIREDTASEIFTQLGYNLTRFEQLPDGMIQVEGVAVVTN